MVCVMKSVVFASLEANDIYVTNNSEVIRPVRICFLCVSVAIPLEKCLFLNNQYINIDSKMAVVICVRL